MKSWLDTETKALLQKIPPEKLAPPDTKAYSLVLLSIFRHDAFRLQRAFQRISGGTKEFTEYTLNLCSLKGLPLG